MLNNETKHILSEEEYQSLISDQLEKIRLRNIIDQAKRESELVELKGRQMIAVPYWFIKT